MICSSHEPHRGVEIPKRAVPHILDTAYRGVLRYPDGLLSPLESQVAHEGNAWATDRRHQVQYAAATCYPGTDEEVEARLRALGFPVFRVTLNKLGRRVSAYPGYLFVDPAFHPDLYEVPGFWNYLMVDEKVVEVFENDLLALQVQVNSMLAMLQNDRVFDHVFGSERSADYFETFGKRLFESVVNTNRFPKGVRHAVNA